MGTGATVKTREEAREWLVKHGLSIAGWARNHGFKYGQVRDVLRKRLPCNHGESHKIAVLLGIKDGFIDEN
jgi:gp16 family phage-associated protein